MDIFNDHLQAVELNKPVAVTIGNFDGVHRGHQALLQRVHQVISPRGSAVVFSFSTHPAATVRPGSAPLKIITPEHKAMLLQNFGVDLLFSIPFTEQFAKQSPEEFLQRLKEATHFDYLILGHDAAMGRNREGTPEKIQALARILPFHVEYLPALCEGGDPISSSRIRQLITAGELNQASILLGRPYSVYSILSSDHTVHLPNLCLPPYGRYAIRMKYNGEEYEGEATLRLPATSSMPELEIHIDNLDEGLYGQPMEVIIGNSS
jgi:riboflavin kinase/FMN adenylyltransferase